MGLKAPASSRGRIKSEDRSDKKASYLTFSRVNPFLAAASFIRNTTQEKKQNKKGVGKTFISPFYY